jgi:hypothetical protein
MKNFEPFESFDICTIVWNLHNSLESRGSGAGPAASPTKDRSLRSHSGRRVRGRRTDTLIDMHIGGAEEPYSFFDIFVYYSIIHFKVFYLDFVVVVALVT